MSPIYSFGHQWPHTPPNIKKKQGWWTWAAATIIPTWVQHWARSVKASGNPVLADHGLAAWTSPARLTHCSIPYLRITGIWSLTCAPSNLTLQNHGMRLLDLLMCIVPVWYYQYIRTQSPKISLEVLIWAYPRGLWAGKVDMDVYLCTLLVIHPC